MNTEERVKKIVSGICGAEVTDLSQGLHEELMLDSLNMVVLLLEIEEEFSIRLDESDMNPFDLETVSDIVALAEKYSAGNNSETDSETDFETDSANRAKSDTESCALSYNDDSGDVNPENGADNLKKADKTEKTPEGEEA